MLSRPRQARVRWSRCWAQAFFARGPSARNPRGLTETCSAARAPGGGGGALVQECWALAVGALRRKGRGGGGDPET